MTLPSPDDRTFLACGGRVRPGACFHTVVSIRYSLLLPAGLLMLMAAGCDLQSPEVTDSIDGTGEVSVSGSFDWSMPDRFGLDMNDDDRPDIPNTREYVLNLDPGACSPTCGEVDATFAVVLDASGVSLLDETAVVIPIDEYEWEIDDGGGVTSITTESSQAVVALPEGTYQVSLNVHGAGKTYTLTDRVSVADVVIVSLGDSFASGEGNPEVPGEIPRWADDGSDGSSPQELDHDAAHRSALAGPAQAALAIERADQHSSVTFLFLAASGASIEEGIVGEGDPAATTDGGGRTLRAQVDELGELLSCDEDGCRRDIDALLLSAGGNDIGFSFALGSLIVLDPSLVVNPIYSNLLDNLMEDIESQIASLPDTFAQLVDALDRFDIGDVYLTAYPDLSSVATGGRLMTCEEVGGDLLPGLEVDRNELEVVQERVQVPLNAMLRDVARTHGWTFVDRHVEEFAGHGYCGTDPYRGGSFLGNPFPDPLIRNDDAGVRWFRQSSESAVIQGGGGGVFRPERLATNGTFHPNEFGHQAYRDALLAALETR